MPGHSRPEGTARPPKGKPRAGTKPAREPAGTKVRAQETSDAPRPRCPRKMMRGWGILLNGKSPYIQVCWGTKSIAEWELAILLRPYPKNHVWRYRLTVGEVSIAMRVRNLDDDEDATEQRQSNAK